MLLPDFLIIGAQKAGSSWLAKNLALHPEVFMSPYEVHFFNLKSNFNKGIDWYGSNFAEAKNGQIIGEKTPNYLWTTDNEIVTRFGTHLSHTPQKIHKLLPAAKLIVTLRNPVERAISAVNHYMTHGQISPLEDINDVLIGDKQYLAHQFGVFDMGRYFHYLNAYRQYFPPEQMLVLIFEEDIVQYPALGLRTTCDFLQINRTFEFSQKEQVQNQFNNRHVNLARLYHHSHFVRPLIHRLKQYLPIPVRSFLGEHLMGQKMTKKRPTGSTLQLLNKMYAEDNEKLFSLINRETKLW